MRVISIDPGEKYVGICIYHQDLQVLQWEIGYYTVQDILKLITNYYQPSQFLIIIEDFVNYTHKNYIKGFKSNKTSEMIGAIESHCFLNHYPLIKQRAVQAKVWNDTRLLRLGLLQKHNNTFYVNNQIIKRHARDAYRHFIYWANKNLFNNCISKEKLFKKGGYDGNKKIN